MGDIVSPEVRRRMMASIRGRDTKPELAVRRLLHAHGLRFRLHVGDLPGRPDIVLPRHRAIVLVHGCFWHRHEGCRYASVPESNNEFWAAKFSANVARDRRVADALVASGWRLFTIWECEVRSGSLGDLPGRIGSGGMLDGTRTTPPRLQARSGPDGGTSTRLSGRTAVDEQGGGIDTAG
jgi:DNA mismatch endonuclease (patch repair protein)